MLKKTIKFHDLDGKEHVEVFYFNLNRAELAIMEGTWGGKKSLTEHLKTLVESDDKRAIMGTFQEILASSVGKRHEDGKRFVKSDEIRSAFLESEAYVELFMELFTQADAAGKFILGIVPQEIANKVSAQEQANHNLSTVVLPAEGKVTPTFNLAPVPDLAVQPRTALGLPTTEKPLSEYTREELLALPMDKFMALKAAGKLAGKN